MEAMMASSDLPDVPPGTELDTYATDVDLGQTQLQMTPDGMITEPVLGIRMLMSSRVSCWNNCTTCFQVEGLGFSNGSHCLDEDIRLSVFSSCTLRDS